MNAPVRPGKVVWIGLRGARREPLDVVEFALALTDGGLEGDHYSRKGGNRQVTLMRRACAR
ncbi:hypothetical protein [Caballeronia novacaledonica]|nr:hypothetical protein [Caballeronia novacaledonica]